MKRRGSRQKLIEQHAQRIDVGASVDVQAVELGLFGAHIFQRADDATTPVNSVRSVSFWPVALATPKSMTLGTGLPS